MAVERRYWLSRLISHETIEAVRHRVSIVSVIGERVRLERRGQSHIGLCPFHKEKTPSFHVNADRGFFYCFGCQAGGNVISFVQQLDGLTFPEAVRELAERAGIAVQETGSMAERQQEAEARRRRDELYLAGSLAAEYFERCLAQHPLAGLARAELQRRKLGPEFSEGAAEALAAFRVGYAPYGWDGLARHLREARFNLRAAEAVGLLGERKSGDGHYDRFRHRLMFAVMDLQGRVIAFSGRSLDEPTPEELTRAGVPAPRQARPAEPPAKYYNSPESPIYRKREAVFGLYQARQATREQDRCVVVEGNFDVVSLHARGIKHVVAPLGTAFTLEQAAQIKRYTNNVTFLFDGDSAGQRATRAAREPCQKQGLLARVAQPPRGLDPDEMVRTGGREAIDRVLSGSRPLLEFLIDSALQGGFATDDSVGRAAKIREVQELIAAEEDPTVRAMAERFADEVAGRLTSGASIDMKTFRAIRTALAGAARGPNPASSGPAANRAAPPEQARSPARVDQIRSQVLGAALEYPALLTEPEVIELLDVADGDLALGLEQVRALFEQGQDLTTASADPAEFLGHFPDAVRPQVAKRLAVPELRTLESARGVLVENLWKLRRLHQRRERASTVEELRKAAATGDVETELDLLRRQLERAKARHGLE